MPGRDREAWRPKAWPPDDQAAARRRAWLEEPSERFWLGRAVMTGARLPSVPWGGAWLVDSDFSRVDLRRANLVRAHIAGSKFVDADLRDADMVKVEGGEAALTRAVLDGADLLESTFMDVDARGASLQRCDLSETHWDNSDLRDARLDGASVPETSFVGTRFDDATTISGMTGSLFGPCVIAREGVEVELAGADLAAWFTERGAAVEILADQTRFTMGDLPPGPSS